jgi:hypothetical protein
MNGREIADITPEFQTFVNFVKRHVNIIVTAAATPILAGFFDLVRIPKTHHPDGGKFLALTSAIVCSLVLLALFWTRYSIARRASAAWLIGGVSLSVLGLGLLTSYVTRVPSPDSVELSKVFPDIFLYLLGFPIFCGGAAVVFLYGFVTTEKNLAFAQIVSRLERVQLQHLEAIARAFESAGTANFDRKLRLSETAKNAFKEGSWRVILEATERMRSLATGRLEIWGPDMDRIYGSFVEAIRKSFHAISRDDLDFWAKPYSSSYLLNNQNLIHRNCVVERIFLIPQDRILKPVHGEAIRSQIEIGIRVRIGYLEDLQAVGIDDRDVDFGLLDDFAVSFWRFLHGRLFRLTVDQEEYKKYRDLYDRIRKICIRVPGKVGVDATLFGSTQELQRWLDLPRERVA